MIQPVCEDIPGWGSHLLRSLLERPNESLRGLCSRQSHFLIEDKEGHTTHFMTARKFFGGLEGIRDVVVRGMAAGGLAGSGAVFACGKLIACEPHRNNWSEKDGDKGDPIDARKLRSYSVAGT